MNEETAVSKSEAPSARALAQLNTTVENLQKLAMTLREKLHPVLSQEVPSSPERSSDELRSQNGNSDLVLLIDEINSKALNVTSVLRDIRNRAEC